MTTAAHAVKLPDGLVAKRYASVSRYAHATDTRPARPQLKPKFTRTDLERWLIKHSVQQRGSIWECTYRFPGCTVHLGPNDVSLDHVEPIVRGGLTTLDNLAVCCQDCNRIKSSDTLQDALTLRDFLSGKRPASGASLDLSRSIIKRLKQPPNYHLGKKRQDGSKPRPRRRFPRGHKPEFGRRDELFEDKDF